MLFAVALILFLGVASTSAQQVTGELGSPNATISIEGKQLPPPPMRFGGKIEHNVAQSRPWWPPRVVPLKGAPNIMLIMTDDTGFGVSGTFGGVIPSPTLDRIAANGLATRTSTRPLYALLQERRSLPAAIITQWARAWILSSLPVIRATTAS